MDNVSVDVFGYPGCEVFGIQWVGSWGSLNMKNSRVNTWNYDALGGVAVDYRGSGARLRNVRVRTLWGGILALRARSPMTVGHSEIYGDAQSTAGGVQYLSFAL